MDIYDDHIDDWDQEHNGDDFYANWQDEDEYEMQEEKEKEESANMDFIIFGITSGFFKWLFG